MGFNFEFKFKWATKLKTSILFYLYIKKCFQQRCHTRSWPLFQYHKMSYEGRNQEINNIFMHNYELFNIFTHNNGIIVKMFTKFTNIINGLQALGKIYIEPKKMIKISRSLLEQLEVKIITIQETKTSPRFHLESLLG